MYTFPLFVRFYGTVTRNEYLIRLEQEDNERRAGISRSITYPRRSEWKNTEWLVTLKTTTTKKKKTPQRTAAETVTRACRSGRIQNGS